MREKLYFQWHITDACNFRCRHCYQSDFTKASDLALADLIKIYENISASSSGRKTRISVTGGEPLLRKDLFDILKYLDRHDTTEELAIITNASLINENIIEKLREIRKLKQVKISLDGATEKVNDLVRKPGAFKMALEKINLVQEKSSFEVIVMFTAMRSNVFELPALFQLCRELKVDGMMIERFIPLGQGAALRSEIISKEDWKRLVGEICECAGAEMAEKDMLACKAFWVKFKDEGVELLGAECNVGEDAFAIMPNGDLLPCRRFAMKIGNLLDNSLMDIIGKSRVLQEVADKSKLKGKCRACRVENCRGCRAIAYAIGKDYLEEDSFCWI